MNELKIEKDIPLPKRGGSGCGLSPLGAVLRQMEVADSVWVDGLSSRNAATYTAHLRPRRFSFRKEGTGSRVWRVA